LWSFFALFLLAFITREALADAVTNLNPVADTGILESNPSNNLGGLSSVPSGTTPMGRSRALFKFDLTQLPTNALITGASLGLSVTTVPSGGVGSIFELNRLLRDWGEGVGGPNGAGSPAKTNEATWNERFHPSLPWGTAGGAAGVDFETAFSATNFVDVLGNYTFGPSPGLLSDVLLWIANPGTNFGWLLMSQDEGTVFTVRRFATREDPVQAPVLTVSYVLPTPAVSPTISSLKVESGQVSFTFQAESNRTYTVEFRGLLSRGSWNSLTNVPAQDEGGAVSIFDGQTASNRFYRVRTP
jgi:hypothetical protein